MMEQRNLPLGKSINKLKIEDILEGEYVSGLDGKSEIIITGIPIDSNRVGFATSRILSYNPLKVRITKYEMRVVSPYLSLDSSKSKELEFK